MTKKLNKSDGQVCHILAIEKEPHQKDKSKRQYNKKSIRLFKRFTSTMNERLKKGKFFFPKNKDLKKTW